MAQATIIWTALPNGFRLDAGTATLKLSIFVSLRLSLDAGQAEATLGSFPQFLDWPARLGGIALDLIVDNDITTAVPTSIVSQAALDSTTWRSLFDQSTLVRSYQFQAPQEPVSSYPASALQDTLYGGYGEVGQASPYQLPDRSTLQRAFPHVFAAVAPSAEPIDLGAHEDLGVMNDSDLAAVHEEIGENLLSADRGSSFDARLRRAIAIAGERVRRSNGRAVPIVPATGNPVSALAQFVAFHRRPARARSVAATPAPDEPDDFHQTLSALGEYPGLLRRLGLVIDVELPAERIPVSISGAASLRRLQVRPRLADGGLADAAYTPNTKYLLDLRQTGSPLAFPVFAAAPQAAEVPVATAAGDPEIIGGLLNVNLKTPAGARQFDLIQVDIDGAVTKVLNAVTNLSSDDQRPTLPIDNPSQSATPAFRSSGLSMVRSGHAESLVDGIRKAEANEAALQNNQLADFFAEDLVRGYRIDVRRSATDPQSGGAGGTPAPQQPWLSLHQRIGSYAFASGALPPLSITDEGFIQPAFVQDATAGTPAADPVSPIYVPESFFHWKGYCLSAPPPLNPLDVTPPSAPVTADPVAPPPFDIEFAAVPGSLPRLRYGSFYEIRARTVDLAGNGPSVGDADNVIAALAAQQGQVPILSDPSGSFRYRRFEPVSPPEPVLRAVLSDGETSDVMVIRSDGSTTAAFAASFDDPGIAAVSERHIVPPKAALSTVETHGQLDGALGASGNPGAYYNICRRGDGSLIDGFVINTSTGNQDPLADVVVTDPVTGVQTTIPRGIQQVTVDGLADANGYIVHYEAQLRLPYLPDPLARGASLFGLPGVSNVTGQLDDSGELTWSDPEHQVLAIPATRDLGFVTKIDFGPGDTWPELLPFRLILDELASDAFPVRPAWNAQTRELTVRLAPGQTCTAWISCYPAPEDVDLFGLHAWWRTQAPPSTDQKNFLNMAQHGALSMLTPPRKMTLVHAVQRPVDPPAESTDSPLRTIKFEKGTTAYIAGAFVIHVASTAKLDLLAEWEEQGEGPDDIAVHRIRSHVFEVAVPPLPNAPGVFEIATLDSQQRLEFQAPAGAVVPAERYLARHEFGDTKYRRVKYTLVATSCFREYFPRQITDNADNLTKSFVKNNVTVLSSAKPPAPEISYIVPSFGWIVDSIGSQVIQSTRRGGGLRVYLGARWFASGAGEQLAVVEAAGVNRWGYDPIRVVTPGTTANSIAPDAPAARAPGSPFDNQIHPYDVGFDKEQGLWFCDVTFSVGDAYFPFRELALVRYQRNSLPGLQASTLVYAGIHQLAPDRAVTLSYTGPTSADPGHRRVAMTVSAIAPSSAMAVAALADRTPIVEVTLEVRDASRSGWDDNLGWTVASADQQPVTDRPPSQSQLWIGHVLLPAQPGATQRRIVVRESEVFPASQSPPGQAWTGVVDGGSRRLVYADTIRID